MKWRLALKPQADRDINNQFEYIAKENLEAAIRFYEAAFRAFDVLLTIHILALRVTLKTHI